MRGIDSLSPREILALALLLERTSEKRLKTLADAVRPQAMLEAERLLHLATEVDHYEERLLTHYRRHYAGDAVDGTADWSVLLRGLEISEEAYDVLAPVDIDDSGSTSTTTGEMFPLLMDAATRARDFYKKATEHAPDGDVADFYKELSSSKTRHVRHLRRCQKGYSA